MGVKVVKAIYIVLLLIWSSIQFVILIPDISDVLFKYCWSKLESGLCQNISGLHAGYRITLASLTFHVLLGILTIDSRCCPEFSNFIHTNCWLLKMPIFVAINILAFVIPLNEVAFHVMYYIYLFAAICFVPVMFVLSLDFSHAWKILWMRTAHERKEEPTCYLCTWLFAIHFVTSILYALIFDIFIAFFFFNPINQCVTTSSFLSINIFLCLIAATFSHFTLLKETKASSQIILSTMAFFVTYITWLALSDPENEPCNLRGTPFSGSKRSISVNFRSLSSCSLTIFCLAFLLFRNETVSFTYSLVKIDGRTDKLQFFGYSRFHLTLSFAACFLLMSMTNWYSPLCEVAVNWDRGKLYHTIDLQEYNYYRFIALCSVSSFLPLSYIGLLVFGLCRRYLLKHPRSSKVKDDSSNDSYERFYLEVTNQDDSSIVTGYEEAVVKLRKTGKAVALSKQIQDVETMALPCFIIRETRLRFWHFPRHISQSYYGGRNGSNACTIIALIIGRLFSRSEIFMPPFGYLPETWINLYTASIVEGNALYDSILKEHGVLDLSIEEAVEHFGAKLNIKSIASPLPVTFESEIETVRVAYQLRRFVNLYKKQVILFIHRFRTGSFLIYPDGSIIFSDSHSYGEEGALLAWAPRSDVEMLTEFLKNVLGTNENKLATLTQIEYESRFKVLRGSLSKQKR